MKRFENYVFDFGGVLYDINPMLTFNNFAAISSSPALFDDPRHFYMEQSVFSDLEKGDISPEEFRNKVISDYKLNVKSDKDFDIIWNKTLTGLKPYSLSVIRELKKNARLYLLSNTNDIHYKYFEPECRELFSYFDGLFFSYKIGFRKPDPQIFEYMANKTGIVPGNSVFIDDTKRNVQSAEKTGFNIFLIENQKTIKDLL